MQKLFLRLIPLFCLLLVWGAVCCQQKPAATVAADLPAIPVSLPVQCLVTDFVDFTGRTDAKESVSVRARVTGYLERLDNPFKEGSEVNAGDILFKIDPRPYQAAVDQAHSQVILNQAQLSLAKITYDRDRSLGSTLATSQQQLDQDKASMDAADARVKASLATLRAAELNLEFTTVKAQISGRVSRYFYTPSNLAVADQTILTTIVSMDPMYVYFDIDSRTYQNYLTAINEGKMKAPMDKGDKAVTPAPPEKANKPDKADKTDKDKTDKDKSDKDKADKQPNDSAQPTYPVLMALENDNLFSWKGTIDFINNQENSSTGTVSMRGVFRNERPPGGTWRLVPGMFVRIQLPIGEPHSALLVIDRAIGSDQDKKFVYVVDDQNKVQYRRVILGSLQDDGLRVINAYNPETKTGLLPTDRVVVGGLPQLRPKADVKIDEIPMPTMASTDATSLRNRPQPPAPGQQQPAKKAGAGNK